MLSVMQGLFANSVRQDQTTHNPQSDLDLHCPIKKKKKKKTTHTHFKKNDSFVFAIGLKVLF